jgi:serine/threonine protein phosphatase PrpC
MDESVNQEGDATEGVVNNLGTTPTVDLKLLEWRIIGETIRGNSHLRDGRPNQDAILQMRESGVYPPIILSISDGHGSNKCFRSDRGSRLAVTIGAQLMRNFLNQPRKECGAKEIENIAREVLPIEFIRKWQEAVLADLKCEPFSKEELEQLENKDGIQAREIVEAHPFLAYGATTLTVALTDSFVIYAQLGDGEIICVSETGEVSKPLPEDERLIANETTSLCTDTAAQEFRIAYQPLTQALPALILMTTDGYANSFINDAGFLQVGSDLFTMFHKDGFDLVNRSVKGWLEEATRMGSGDDCTLGIICRMDILQDTTKLDSIPVQEGVTQHSSKQEPVEEDSKMDGKQTIENS